MVVRPDGAFHGTIGGGQLEWQMLAAPRDVLGRGRRAGAARSIRRSGPISANAAAGA